MVDIIDNRGGLLSIIHVDMHSLSWNAYCHFFCNRMDQNFYAIYTFLRTHLNAKFVVHAYTRAAGPCHMPCRDNMSTSREHERVGSGPPTSYQKVVCGQKMAAETEGGASIVRRNRPGTKAKDMYNWPDQDFNDMETVLAGKLPLEMCVHHIHISLVEESCTRARRGRGSEEGSPIKNGH